MQKTNLKALAVTLLGAIMTATPAPAQLDPPSWTRPVAPFNLIGPIDYVGTEGLAAYLIHTRDGAILIDAPMEENAKRIEQGIEARGVKLKSVRLLLLSHAHFDHAGGLAALKKATGARLVVGAGDKAAVDTGIPPGETSYGVIRFPAAKVDLAVRDGGKLTLGGVTLTALATPGHTPGCTSWKMRIVEKGKPLDILFACSITVAGNKLIGNKRYHGIVEDFRRSFAKLEHEKADVVLPFHPETTDLFARAKEGRLIDRATLPDMVRKGRAAFEADLAKQQAK